MSVSIFTMTHKKFEDPKDRIYIPLHVGRERSGDLGYLGDNTGDNISMMNCYYSELTGMYWVWKNFKASDYIGMCHYRRYLVNENDIIFNENDYNRILKNYDIITTKKLRLNFEYYYGYSVNYNINDLMVTGEVLSEKYPKYYKNFAEMIHGNETYFGNILVTSHKLFNEYSAWLFDILFEVQKRIDLNAYTDDYHRRVFGFISEFLLTLWVRTRNLKVYESKVGMTTEKYETRVMKERLSAYFKKRDIEGAKEYFIKSLEKRPDVLMEASDITGELKLSMQVTATSDIEFRTYCRLYIPYHLLDIPA